PHPADLHAGRAEGDLRAQRVPVVPGRADGRVLRAQVTAGCSNRPVVAVVPSYRLPPGVWVTRADVPPFGIWRVSLGAASEKKSDDDLLALHGPAAAADTRAAGAGSSPHRGRRLQESPRHGPGLPRVPAGD